MKKPKGEKKSNKKFGWHKFTTLFFRSDAVDSFFFSLKQKENIIMPVNYDDFHFPLTLIWLVLIMALYAQIYGYYYIDRQ